jgi:predicted RND superfamily exporter protein
MINKKLDEEEKWKFILEQCEKDPLVKKVMANALKKQKIEKEILPNKDLVESLISVAKLTNFVSDIEAKHYFKDPEYNEIYKNVKKSFLSNTIDSELIKRYNANIAPVIKRINYFIRKYERKIYGKKYSEIQTLKKSDRSDKDEIIQSIKKSHFKDPVVSHFCRKVYIPHVSIGS